MTYFLFFPQASKKLPSGNKLCRSKGAATLPRQNIVRIRVIETFSAFASFFAIPIFHSIIICMLDNLLLRVNCMHISAFSHVASTRSSKKQGTFLFWTRKSLQLPSGIWMTRRNSASLQLLALSRTIGERLY